MISTRRKTNADRPETPRDNRKDEAEVNQAPIKGAEAVAEGVVTGSMIMDEAVKEPTLDRFLDGNPKVINDEAAYYQLAETLRKKRAMDITIEAKKKAKKEGVEDESE